MKPLVVDPDALADLAEAQDWYDERQEGLGQELHAEVATALSRIRSDPGIGARYRDTAFRFYKVKRFPYVIYYRICQNESGSPPLLTDGAGRIIGANESRRIPNRPAKRAIQARSVSLALPPSASCR